MTYKIGDFDYIATKLVDGRVQQTNTTTTKIRYFTPVANNGSYSTSTANAGSNSTTNNSNSNNNNYDKWQSFDNTTQSFITPILQLRPF